MTKYQKEVSKWEEQFNTYKGGNVNTILNLPPSVGDKSFPGKKDVGKILRELCERKGAL